jgi:acyl-CoA thioester hydrolase
MIYEVKFRVRSYECDSYGHVNNANYLNYLEYGRYEFMRSIGLDYLDFVADGFGVFVAKVEIEYKIPAQMDDELVLRTEPVKRAAVSGIMAQELYRPEKDGSETLIAKAKVTWASVNNKTGAPCRLPPKWELPGLQPEQK